MSHSPVVNDQESRTTIPQYLHLDDGYQSFVGEPVIPEVQLPHERQTCEAVRQNAAHDVAHALMGQIYLEKQNERCYTHNSSEARTVETKFGIYLIQQLTYVLDRKLLGKWV